MHSLEPKSIKKILIRTTNWIGDAVMTTPAMGVIRHAFPEAEITVASNPTVAELFFHHPYCDRVVIWDKRSTHKGIGGLLRFCKELSRERFDLAIMFQNAIEAAIIAFVSGIPLRIGYATDGRGILLTHPVSISKAERRLHHTAYYLHMLDAAGIGGGSAPLTLRCTDEELLWARKTLGEGTWIAINPGAAYGSAKRWLPERFAAVGDILSKELNARVILTGGHDESDTGREIERTMNTYPLNFIGKTTVRELMSLLSQCRLIVTNDSGPMHVAAAFGVPIVAIFGSTDHTTTSPLTSLSRIVRKEIECAPCMLRKCQTDHRCMKSITVKDVMEAARSLLGACRLE